MAVEPHQRALNGKAIFAVLAPAALVCAAVVLYVLHQIDTVRDRVSTMQPGAFNYLMQADHNVDTLVYAFDKYSLQNERSADLDAARDDYLRRFDVLWSFLKVFEVRFPDNSANNDLVAQFVADADKYLKTADPLMSSDYYMSADEIQQQTVEVVALGEAIRHISQEYFFHSAKVRDRWSEQLDLLYRVAVVFALLLMLIGGLLVAYLYRTKLRALVLVEESRETEAELTRLVSELRSGRLEQKAKDSFIAAASHDLRQPLHALGLFLGALDRHVGETDGRYALDEAKQCTSALNSLFNSLLDLSRLDAGVVEVVADDFDLGSILEQLQQELAPSAAQAGVVLRVDTARAFVHTDVILLGRIIRNLLDNALLHSRATAISILVDQQIDTVSITVSDNGRGIPENEQHDIFSEYYQLENPNRDRSKGLGLGLSIVKRLSQLLEYGLTLTSSPGVGTTFVLTVPAGVRKTEPAIDLERGLPAVAAHVVEDRLVAVIDDEENIRLGMEIMLGSFGCSVITAGSAVELIDALRTKKRIPECLIADYRLRNDETGDDAIHAVRDAFGVDIPATIITGDTSPGRVSEAVDSGFTLMHKPVEPNALLECIQQMLAEQPADRSSNSNSAHPLV